MLGYRANYARWSSAPLVDVFGRLHDAGGTLSHVLESMASWRLVATVCCISLASRSHLGVLEPEDGELVEPAVHVPATCVS